VIGNVFLPPTAYGGKLEWVRDLVQRNGDRFPVADKMIEVARHHGFDGWFVNQETAGGDAALAAQMRDFLTYLKASGLRIIWYDAMTKSGSVSWQNALTEQNRMFFEQSDEMFLNFWWNATGLANSAALAKSMNRSPYDLASGVDVEANGYNTRVGWDAVFPEGKPHTTSLGFYRPEWTFKSAQSVPQFYQQDNKFWIGPNGDPANTATTEAWKGVAHFVTEQTPITTLPFVTNFNTGHGTRFSVDGKVLSTSPWNNLSLQDVLPTWRWTVTSTGTKVTPSLDFGNAYDGGSSLRITGRASAPNDIRLYATKLRLARYSRVEVAFRGNARLQLLLRFNNNAQTVVDVGQATNAWQRKVIMLSTDGFVRELTEISVRVPSGAVDVNIGRIAVHESAPQPILPPNNVQVEQVGQVNDTTASVRLTWTKAPLKPREYRVFQRHANGTRTYLGGTPNDAYFVPAVAKRAGESVTIEIVSISDSFLTSAPVAVIVT
jgi:endo-beta-N-acetylglucosaminidase D